MLSQQFPNEQYWREITDKILQEINLTCLKEQVYSYKPILNSLLHEMTLEQYHLLLVYTVWY